MTKDGGGYEMIDLSKVFNGTLEDFGHWLGYWLLNTMLYMAIASIIWFCFVFPIIREKKSFGPRYENFARTLFGVLMVIVAICSLLALCQIGLLPATII